MNFNIIGNIFDSTGYASHTRNLANALFSLSRVRLSTSLVNQWQSLVSDKELEMIKRKPEKDEINLIITNPLYWRLNTSGKRNWAYLIWEGNKVPKCFIDECLNPHIEYILVPSMHTLKAIRNTALNEISSEEEIEKVNIILQKTRIIPHGVDLNLFYPTSKPEKCTFIANKGLRGPEDRGGIQYLIKAYLEEFNDEDVELIIKINPAYGIIDISKLIDLIVDKKAKYPKITIIDQLLDYKELVKLYNKANVFVSPTRAEAFNIPCLEAMACGLPVITTNFGGQTDFVNDSNGWLINGELTEVKWDLMYEGIKWLTPDLNQLKKNLREIYENKSWLNKIDSSIETAKQFTWENSAKQLISLAQYNL